jgi:2-polyprenyl-3-methyl-5-hydroxy-6-metoxy-1,4-benzoquinol methylase
VTLFPLDRVRHAGIDRDFEPLLQDVRDEVATYDMADMFEAEELLEAFDQARPRLNVLISRLCGMVGRQGADISTGPGFLPLLLRRQGLDVVATEKDAPTSQFASACGIEVRPYCIGKDRPPFAPESLDFVVFAEVLEHLKLSPLPVVRELASLLRASGIFILTTPNVARLHHIESLAAGENFLELFPEDLPLDTDATDFIEHVREYSIREVVDIVEHAGLTVDSVEMTGWGTYGYEPVANPYAAEIIVLVATRESG